MSIFNLDLQFFAQKKAGGTANTNRSHTSISKRLGIKKHDGEKVKGGMIIVRQRGNSILVKKGDKSVGVGKDFTIFALKEGEVKYYSGRQKRTFVRVS